MRPWLVAVLVLASVWVGLGALEAKESEDLRVRARVREYTEAATADLRRGLIVRELLGVDAAVAARLVREALLSEARRAAALDLAARLRLPGLLDLARRWADTPAGPQVVAYAAASPDAAAAAWLVERWANTDPATERFRALDEALRTLRVAPAVVEGIGRFLADPARAARAVEVLRVQMAVEDAGPADLHARWPAAWATYAHEAREHPPDGEDLLAAPGWRLRTARRVGRNLRLAPRSAVDLASLPLPAQTDPGTFRVRVAAGGPGAYVGLVSANADGPPQELRLRCDADAWYLVEGAPREGARVDAPFRPGAWSEIEVRVTDPRLPGRPSVRDLRVLVDGTELRPSGGFWRLAAPPAGLTIGASSAAGEGAAPTLVGGITWRRAGT